MAILDVISDAFTTFRETVSNTIDSLRDATTTFVATGSSATATRSSSATMLAALLERGTINLTTTPPSQNTSVNTFSSAAPVSMGTMFMKMPTTGHTESEWVRLRAAHRSVAPVSTATPTVTSTNASNNAGLFPANVVPITAAAKARGSDMPSPLAMSPQAPVQQ
ncbi:hypothetical protein BH10PSE19_BH10PSE19_13010 [soil metagenome]